MAPLKLLSIPRLELEACVLGSRLVKSICDGHSIKVRSCQIWSDSKTALACIKSDHRRYKQFVAFRVSEEKTNILQWRYVPTSQNVADEGTKWEKSIDFEQSSRWFSGPQFLYHPDNEWPMNISKQQRQKRKFDRNSIIVSTKNHQWFSWIQKIIQVGVLCYGG